MLHSVCYVAILAVLTSVDTLQIHWPVTEPQKRGDRIDPSVKETWTAMEKLVDEVTLQICAVSRVTILVVVKGCIAALHVE